ncbi:hypothetical protein [Variovorax soli]|uniref:Membrane protein YeaQ/YmgE (Transglycosylase-associated protein family) n=1 Tax=Variovorax soli TaxID=376815 RepID=A0ABU1N7Q9_9BURK|nr:hypothetical protein [Variovorax soli]MDR6534403.1 putative membrane protein YeaQ/YmgE (transglycosylase-associated protein family) [Variovorax soli]
MRKFFLIRTLFGTCCFAADEKWRRALLRGPWVILLALLSASMAFTAASGVAARMGFAAFFMAVEFGIVGAFVAHAAFVSWCSMTNKVSRRLARAANDASVESISWRVFGIFLIAAASGVHLLLIAARS